MNIDSCLGFLVPDDEEEEETPPMPMITKQDSPRKSGQDQVRDLPGRGLRPHRQVAGRHLSAGREEPDGTYFFLRCRYRSHIPRIDASTIRAS
jgi:hypothetical protein